MRRFLSHLREHAGARIKATRIRLRGATLRGRIDHNIWYLYVEVFWAAMLSAAAAFNATYAVRLGASNTMIGWISLQRDFSLLVSKKGITSESGRQMSRIG